MGRNFCLDEQVRHVTWTVSQIKKATIETFPNCATITHANQSMFLSGYFIKSLNVVQTLEAVCLAVAPTYKNINFTYLRTSTFV